MRKTITLLTIALFSLLLFTNAKPQDSDPNVGFYVDGIKVTELTCYSFKTLTAVLPYNSANSLYDQFVIDAFIPDAKFEIDCGVISTDSKAGFLSTYVKGKYAVYEIYSENTQTANSTGGLAQFQMPNGTKSPTRNFMHRSALAYYASKDKPEETLEINLYGQKISGYEEQIDPNDGTLKRMPVYKTEKIGNSLKITLKNRIQNNKPYKMKVDLAQPCVVSGTKVNFNSIGK